MPRTAVTYSLAALAAILLVAIGVTAWVAVTGSSSSTDTSGAPLTTGGARNSVEIRDFKFTPGNLQIAAGGTITFHNFDGAPHTATARDGSFDTGTLQKDDDKTLTFDTPGDFDYFCTIHPGMKAVVHVKSHR